MKTIKIHFVGFWVGFEMEDNMFVNILRERYKIVYDSINPDFLICSPLCKPFEYMKYDCPRIMYTGEFISADFTAIDYFIGFDDIQFGDRCLRFPLFLYYTSGVAKRWNVLTADEAARELKSKEYFCNYIFGHDTATGKREAILERLQKYKRVECAGKHRNNMPNGQTFDICSKRAFMRKCKFSITAESVCYPGFTSEKLSHAFHEFSIPIYYGDPDVLKCFNSKAFIDCNNPDLIDDVMERIIQIDNDDDLYIEMLCQNRYVVEDYEERMYEKLRTFLFNIFDQDKDAAYRRPRFYRSGEHEAYLKEYAELQGKLSYRIYKKTGM